MNVFQCKPTEISPLVHLNPENGELTIEGNAIPDDAEAFFTPILEWLDEYIKNTTVKTTLNLKLHYFNVSSSKRILFIFYKLNELVKKNRSVVVKWHYVEGEDEMFEVGQDFAFMVNIPFHFIEYNPYVSVSA
ncbi:MAG: nuclear pore complex subunit [Crocinitomicaceae bacterium]|nr:nuclear pore complex subunit [Crocinitomicaceae bacterium]|tara:strand:+ start:775 stop:1173 length:399 start_codon:yes stop_codon:yes gene_type:complete